MNLTLSKIIESIQVLIFAALLMLFIKATTSKRAPKIIRIISVSLITIIYGTITVLLFAFSILAREVGFGRRLLMISFGVICLIYLITIVKKFWANIKN